MENILNVSIDVKKGVYVISRNNGAEIVTKTISRKEKSQWDIQRRRKEIQGSRDVSKGTIKQLDPLLYDALELFDMKYGTNYKTIYFKVATRPNPAKFSENQKEHKQRVKAEREQELKGHGIIIEEVNRGNSELNINGKNSNIALQLNGTGKTEMNNQPVSLVQIVEEDGNYEGKYSEGTLNVNIDSKSGVYIITRNSGEKVVVKPIKGSSNPKTMERRREEIKGKKWVPEELLKQLDPILYDALEQFDIKYGTNYSVTYFEVMAKQISKIMASEKNNVYKARMKEERSKMLRQAGMQIENSREARTSESDSVQSLKDKISSRTRGINNLFSLKKKTLRTIANSEATKIFIQDDDIPDIPDMPEGFDTVSSDVLEKTGVTYDIVNQIKIEKPEIAVQEETPKQEPSLGEQRIKVKTQKQAQEPPKVEPNKQSKGRIKQQSSSIEGQEKPKKKIKRCKRVQAAKQAEREAKRYKNLHKAKVIAEKQEEEAREAKIRAEEEAARLAEERKLTVRLKRTIKNQYDLIRSKVPDLTEPKRQFVGIMGAITIESNVKTSELNDKKEEIQETIIRYARTLKDRADSIKNKIHIPNMEAQKKNIIGIKDSMISYIKQQAEEMGRKAKGKTVEAKETSLRFTRELKDKTDSIRNKVHVPKIELNKRNIAGVAAGAVLILLFAAGSTNLNARADSLKMEHYQEPSIATVETVENSIHYSQMQKGEVDKKEVKKQEESQKVKTETSKKDSKKDYLSSIKVGSTMKIESGRYYETPEGTGKSGSFKKQQNGVKEISLIGISTKDGYINITSSDVNLYELKQQYPDAKFSFHIVCRNEDGTVRTLGWLTENSAEQTIENNGKQVEDSER